MLWSEYSGPRHYDATFVLIKFDQNKCCVVVTGSTVKEETLTHFLI